MGNKTRTTNYDILDKMLADSNSGQRADGANHGGDKGENVQGTWITSKEQFDQHYKSVNDVEKYLRS